MSTIIVDARGHRCPVPSLRLRKAMEVQGAGAQFTLLATDAMARIDVPFLMQELGGQVLQIEEVDGVLNIIVSTGAAPTD
ncbi:sulfurtransferase TusA family protein [Brevundimonas diminuta]|uniref:sulfurtransferase TusA family protein n=1 Tax=Brevundimonas diminuta TaxID=293 RepID=UPI003D08E322